MSGVVAAMPVPIWLAALAELEDPGSRGFSVAWRDELVEGFLVRRDGSVYGYRNRCPHVGAPLDWSPDQFLDAEGAYIQCAMHGALFEIDSGRCVSGPCLNRALEPLPLTLRDGGVWLSP